MRLFLLREEFEERKREMKMINLILNIKLKNLHFFRYKNEQNDGENNEEKDIQEDEDNSSVGCRRRKG